MQLIDKDYSRLYQKILPYTYGKIMLGIDVDGFRNNIIVAVDRLGGPTKAAHAAGVSNATIHNWIKRRYISDIEKAKLLASLTGLDVQQLRATR